MKNFLMTVFTLCFLSCIFAQDNLTQAEYFFDTDPGVGNGVPISVPPGSTIDNTFTFSTSGLDIGFHHIYIRAKAQNGSWGLWKRHPFYVIDTDTEEYSPTASDIIGGEYFFDTDPGVGNGIPIAFDAGGSIDTDFSFNVSGLAVGFHYIYVRVKDADNNWGLWKRHPFYVIDTDTEEYSPTASDIIGGEYFFDTDPGVGNGIPIAFDAGGNIDTNFSFSVSGLAVGFHYIYVRVKDADNNWGLWKRHPFYVFDTDTEEYSPTASDIVGAEYFVDTDPGVGNGVPIAVEAGNIVSNILNIDVSPYSDGEHYLYVRVKDEDGQWSLWKRAQFIVDDNLFSVTTSSLPTIGGTTIGDGIYESEESVTVTATANPGFIFEKWTEDSITVSTTEDYTFTITENRNLVAHFSGGVPQYTIATSSSPANGGTTTGYGDFESGESVTVTATANSGYTFEKWTEDGITVSTTESYTFTVSGNHNLVAHFTLSGDDNEFCGVQLAGNPVDVTGWTLSNQSYVNDDMIVLTNPNNYQTGYIYRTIPYNLPSDNQFEVSFDFRIANSSNPTADGLAFWCLSNPPAGFVSGGGLGLPSNLNGITLIFDTYNNGGSVPNPLISLREFNGESYVEGSNTGLLTPDVGNQSFITDGNWHTCVLTYNAGYITVAFDGNAPIMSGTTNTMTFPGYFGFSSSTGGRYAQHAIKNVTISGLADTWYKDEDDDGYSDGTSLTQCEQPEGYKLASDLISTNGDCNDNNPDINPGMSEICNGIDDNCDEQVDEGLEDCLVDCTGTPESGFANATPSSGEPGSTYGVSASGYSVNSGLEYAWYYSLNGGSNWEFYDSSETYFDLENLTAPIGYDMEIQWRLGVYCEFSEITSWSVAAVFTTNSEPVPTCPELTVAPPNVTFEDSVCIEGCEVLDGVIYVPETSIPDDAIIQYAVNNGNWTTTLPTYDPQNAMTIKTRLICTYDPNVFSPESVSVTTAPGQCPMPVAPVIHITNNNCDDGTEGSIAFNGCEGGTIWWSLDNVEWVSVLESTPLYDTENALTIYAKCENQLGCFSPTTTAVSLPEHCYPPCDEVVIEAFATDLMGTPIDCVGEGKSFYVSIVLSGGSENASYSLYDSIHSNALTTNLSENETYIAGPYIAGTSISFTATGNENPNCTAISESISPTVGPNITWYIDNDGDGYGTHEEIIVTCVTTMPGYSKIDGDCDDNDSTINPGAQTLTFLGTGEFVNKFISQTIGAPDTTFEFVIVYTDENGNLPPYGFPRVILDYEGNGVFTNPNDRILLMEPVDENDTDTTDGKVYKASIHSLPTGTNWKTQIQVQNGTCITVSGSFDYPDVLIQPNLQIFASDIEFDNPHPDESSPLKVFATIHNTSDLPAENFVVHLENQYDFSITYPDITVDYLEPHSNTTVSWDIITPNEPSWNPMEVFVDYTDVVMETNELDNRAIRPFINGDYYLPGNIEITAVASPASQPANPSGRYVTISGYAIYTDTAVELEDPSVAGATVTFINPITGNTETALTNSHGYFSLTTFAGYDAGEYEGSGEITDYTLTGDFTVNWSLTTPTYCNKPDLRTYVVLNKNQMFPGETVSGTITVTNQGNTATTISSLLAINQTNGLPVLDDVLVPPLEPGESFTYNFSDIQFNDLGNFSICATADANNQIDECDEYFFQSHCGYISVVPPLPDLQPSGGTSGSVFFCQAINPSFSVVNIGYASSGMFDCSVDVYYEGEFVQTFTHSIDDILPNNSKSFTIPFNYDELGQYAFNLKIDVPLPNGMVVEINEGNNEAWYNVNVIPCKPDLTVLGCRELDVDPEDVTSVGTATYTARIRNNGNAVAPGPIEFEFFVSTGQTYPVQYPNDLAPGETVTVSTTAPTVPSGVATLTATVDPNNLIDEFSESNNSTSNNLCYEFRPIDRPPYCGYDFWNYTYSVNTTANLSVALRVDHLYKASLVKVRFEVSGPGINGTAFLGDAIVQNTEQTSCLNCPFYTASLPVSFLFNEVGTYTFTMTADPTDDYAECNESNNVLVRQVHVNNLPDMRILSQYINPTLLNPDPDQAIFFDISYENIGKSNITDQMKLALKIDNDIHYVMDNVPGLIKNQIHTVTIPMPYSTSLEGLHVARAIIDYEDEIIELNELNNEATRSFVVGRAANLRYMNFSKSNTPADGNGLYGGGADDGMFVLSSFDTPTPQADDDEQFINSIIGNNGELDVVADLVLTYVNNSGQTVEFATVNLSIPSGGEQIISLPWTPLDYSIVLSGEVVNASELEFDELDNFATMSINVFDVELTSTPSCESSDTLGSLTAMVSDGVPPYTYSWSNGTFGQILEALAGTYSVVVTDHNGDQAFATGTIEEDSSCIVESCALSVVSFNVPQACDPDTGMYNTTLIVAYQNEPETGQIVVNGINFDITGSPQTFLIPFESGDIIYEVSFTNSNDCLLTVVTGESRDECVPVPPEDQCSEPEDVIVTEIGSTIATITWSGDASVWYYQLMKNVSELIEDGFTTVNTLSFTGLEPDTNYTFYVSNYCNGEEWGTKAINFTTLEDVKPEPENCIEDVPGTVFAWDYLNGQAPSKPVTGSGSVQGEAGMVFDIYRLDNSFDLIINGTHLTTMELQFQQQTSSLIQNVRFAADGASWGNNGIPGIWTMIGDAAKPILRISIDENGNVSMEGTRSMNNYMMEPLELFGGNTFNTMTLQENNDIGISQKVYGRTAFGGQAFGYRYVECPTACAENSNVYVSAGNTKTALYTLDESFNLTMVGSPSNHRYNAIGISPVDGYIYGMNTQTSHLLRIHPNTGEVTDMGKVPNLPDGDYTGATFDSAGNFYVAAYGAINAIYKIAIAEDGAATAINLSRGMASYDIAYNPNDGMIYGVYRTGRLYRINPANGNTTTFGAANQPNSPFGGMYFDGNNLIAQRNTNGDIVSFDLSTGVGTVIGQTTVVLNTDMASCVNGAMYARPAQPQPDLFQFAYHPNPVKDMLYINTNREIETIKVYNLANQAVLNLDGAKAVNGEVNVTNLPQGVYLVRTVLEGGQVETFKIVKK